MSMVMNRDVQAAQQGNQDAFRRLITGTQNITTSIAFAIVRDIDASEDVAQQVYIKLWQQIKNVKKPDSFLPWLRQVTRYTAVNYLRDNKVGAKLDTAENDALLGSIEAMDEDALTSISRIQASKMLSQFIDELSEESRELVLLYYREEQSSAHVAQLLDLSEANVRKKLSRIRQTLKQEWLEKYGKLALSTVPSSAFSITVLQALVAPAPVAATTLSTKAAATKSGVGAHAIMLLSGSVIGALAGIAGVLLGNHWLIQNIKDDSYKPHLKRYRNWTIAWVAVSGILLTLSYELTSGWWAPVTTYSLFALGLVRLVESTQLVAAQAGLKRTGMFGSETKKGKLAINAMNWAGPLMGGIGMVIGLINAGRLVI